MRAVFRSTKRATSFARSLQKRSGLRLTLCQHVVARLAGYRTFQELSTNCGSNASENLPTCKERGREIATEFGLSQTVMSDFLKEDFQLGNVFTRCGLRADDADYLMRDFRGLRVVAGATYSGSAELIEAAHRRLDNVGMPVILRTANDVEQAIASTQTEHQRGSWAHIHANSAQGAFSRIRQMIGDPRYDAIIQSGAIHSAVYVHKLPAIDPNSALAFDIGFEVLSKAPDANGSALRLIEKMRADGMDLRGLRFNSSMDSPGKALVTEVLKADEARDLPELSGTRNSLRAKLLTHALSGRIDIRDVAQEFAFL